MLDTLQLAFVQRGIAEVLLLSVACGLLGTWIVLRGLAFFSHAVGTAAFPGLVLADGIGLAPALGAFGAAVAFAGVVALLAGRRHTGWDSLTAVVLAGALALGIVLASDVFGSGARVESLLFGSLLLLDTGDLLLAGAASALAVGAGLVLGPRWMATGFDPDATRALGLRTGWSDAALLAVVAIGTVAALAAVGALLASALVLVPAATVRLWTRRLPAWQAGAVGLAAVEGVAGILLSVETNAPPGATIAVIAGGVFALALFARYVHDHASTWSLRDHANGAGRAGTAAGVVVACVALLGVAAGCGGGGSAGGGDRVAVVVSTTIVADLVGEVGGDRVAVTGLLAPNTDPHDYEPRPDDVVATAGADLVVVSGRGLDDWMGEVVDESGGDAAVLDAGEATTVTLPGEGDDEIDPHWWHDPRNAADAVAAIRDALGEVDPEGSAAYAARADAALAEIRALDAGIARCVDGIPAARRVMVTDHDAFGYLASRYGIEVVGTVIPSQTSQAQASARDVARLTALIRRRGVAAVFPESSLSPRLATAIARSSGARADLTLYGDTLGPAGSDGATYLTMMAANADAVTRGLTGGDRGCAPAAGG